MIDYFNNNLASFWFSIGFLLLAIEVFAFSFATGILLFGSIGALITGTLLWFGIVPQSWLVGVALFTITSALSALVLWQPLKRMQSGAKLGQDKSSDLIGYEFILDQTITATQPGQERYSGIDWRVELQDDDLSIKSLEKGEKVRVVKVDAGVFRVTRS